MSVEREKNKRREGVVGEEERERTEGEGGKEEERERKKKREEGEGDGDWRLISQSCDFPLSPIFHRLKMSWSA